MPTLESSLLAPVVLNKSGWLLPSKMSVQGQREPEHHVKPVKAEARMLPSLPRGDNTAAGMAFVWHGWSTSEMPVPLHKGLKGAGLTFLLCPLPFMKDESRNLWQFSSLPNPVPNTA